MRILLTAQLFNRLVIFLDALAQSVYQPHQRQQHFPHLGGKLGLEHLGKRPPILFTSPRVVLIRSLRTATAAWRARTATKSCRTFTLRCSIGNNDCGSIRPTRASLFASTRSFLRLRRLVPSISRGLATSTSCPQPTTT